MLVNCVAYMDGKKVADLTLDQISEVMHDPKCFVWIALKDPSVEELNDLQHRFNLHELAVEDAHHGHQRPKLEEYGDSVFLVLHVIDMKEGRLTCGEVAIFVAEDYVVSVRNNTERGFSSVRARCEGQPELLKLGSAFVCYALMDAVVDRYFPVVDALENELEEIESQIFTQGAERANIQRLYDLKRKVVSVKHAVTPLMEATLRLFGGRVPRIFGNTQEYFRDVHDHLVRINTSLDTIRETINTAIQVNLSMVAIDDSNVNKRLAAWAAIFAVATAFFGLWGMNFEVMPELQWRYGYPVAVGTVVLVCVLLYRRFRRAGWL